MRSKKKNLGTQILLKALNKLINTNSTDPTVTHSGRLIQYNDVATIPIPKSNINHITMDPSPFLIISRSLLCSMIIAIALLSSVSFPANVSIVVQSRIKTKEDYLDRPRKFHKRKNYCKLDSGSEVRLSCRKFVSRSSPLNRYSLAFGSEPDDARVYSRLVP